MKELILIRHAKSDWGYEGLRDIDRSLNQRGYANAYLLSEWYATAHKAPDLLISSTAVRAYSTAMIFAREMRISRSALVLESRIYEAHRDTLKEIIAEQNNNVGNLMLVGHNPGFTDLCNALTDDLFFDNLPTCGIVKISGNCKSWREFADGRWRLEFYKFPKDYRVQD